MVWSTASSDYSETQGGHPKLEGMDTRGDGDGTCWYCGVARGGWGVRHNQQLSVFGGFESGERQAEIGISWLFSRLMSLQVTLICWTV